MSRTQMVVLNRQAVELEKLLPSLTPRAALEVVDQLQHLTNKALAQQATTIEYSAVRQALRSAKRWAGLK